MEKADIEKIKVAEILSMPINDKEIGVCFYCVDKNGANLLSKVIYENEIVYNQYLNDSKNAVFEIRFDNETLRYDSGKTIEQNGMYLELFEHYPVFISVGYKDEGGYHTGDMKKQLPRP